MKISSAATTAVVALALSACSGSQISPRTRDIVEARVEHNTTRFLLATQSLDVDSASAFLSGAADVVFVSDGTIITTAAEFTRLMAEGFADVAEQTLNPGPLYIVPMSATSAVVTGNGVFTMMGTEGVLVEGVQAYTLVWQKIEDDWKIVQGHFSTQPVSVTQQ